MNKNDPRESYWNESYANYWQKRVNESSENGPSTINKGDSKTEGDWVYRKLFQDNIFNPGSILDVGCAWGRMFYIYLEYGLSIRGIDISETMVNKANSTYINEPKVLRIEKGIAEKLPYQDNQFDNLVCLAVFDATYQNKALSEFIRVIKPGGKVYLTGKSTRYSKDDDLALKAEIGARKKKHPNYFTDVSKMLKILNSNHIKILSNYYFKKRGDFATYTYSRDNHDPFYEWLIIFQKTTKTENREIESFSCKYSETFKNKIKK